MKKTLMKKETGRVGQVSLSKRMDTAQCTFDDIYLSSNPPLSMYLVVIISLILIASVDFWVDLLFKSFGQ